MIVVDSLTGDKVRLEVDGEFIVVSLSDCSSVIKEGDVLKFGVDTLTTNNRKEQISRKLQGLFERKKEEK